MKMMQKDITCAQDHDLMRSMNQNYKIKLSFGAVSFLGEFIGLLGEDIGKRGETQGFGSTERLIKAHN